MCDAFETGKCPCTILVTSNATCFRQFQRFLTDKFIIFDIVSFSDTDKGILLFSQQDREECHTFFKKQCMKKQPILEIVFTSINLTIASILTGLHQPFVRPTVHLVKMLQDNFIFLKTV